MTSGFNTNYTSTPAKTPLLNELKSKGYEVEQKYGQYYVKIDGMSVQVKPGDTVFSLKQKIEDKKQQEDYTSKYDKYIEENEAKSKEHGSKFYQALNLLKILRGQRSSFERECGITSLTSASLASLDAEKKAQGTELMLNINSATSAKHKELAAVLSVNNDLISAYLDRGRAESARILGLA